MVSTPTLFNKLKLTKENGLFIFSENKWRGQFSQKIEYALNQIKPFAFFAFNKEPLILFFDIALNKRNEKSIHKQCWNFNKAPVIFINSDSNISIYNGFSFNKVAEKLNQLADYQDVEKFDYWKIVTGELWNEYQKEFQKENRVDYKLLKNIERTREILINEKGLNKSIVNRLVGRLIFSRYLIDRRVDINFRYQNNQKLTKENLPDLILNKERLYEFFGNLKRDFNGDLFPLEETRGEKIIVEKDQVTSNHLNVLAKLFGGYDLDGQLSLFNIFDFDIIPVEFVSNVYEYFMGRDRQENDKAFYTPPFLVDYILSQTVIPYFKNNKTISCRTLDPACGSGIFLVETLRLIVSNFQKLNPQIDQSSKKYKNALKKLLTDNIFGIDKNREAIEIAVFSLYITLLDFFEEPKDIKDFKFPPLFDTNFFHDDFFNEGEEHPFNEVLKSKKPHFILGNPPWGKVKESPYMDYIKRRGEKEKTTISISNKQIAQAFLLRVSDFCSSMTKCSLIVSSKILYNLRADKFRAYYLDKFHVKEVLEISPVRKLIFAKAVGPAAILTYQFAHGAKTDDNFVEHISLKPNPFFALFKSILIEKYDYKEIKQSYFKEYDWIWKVLVYGSVLDFYFLRRLRNKEKYPHSLKSIIEDYELLISTGVNKGSVDKNDASHLVGLPFIEGKRKDLQKFRINFRKGNKWSIPIVHRPRNPNLYKAPILLIKNGLQNDFSLISSISYKNVVFTTNILGIKNFRKNHILEILLGLYLSKLHTFHLFISGSSTGIEREQIMFEELYSFPIILSEKIVTLVQKLSSLYEDKFLSINDMHFQILISETEKKLNELIYTLYNLSEKDKSLLDYAFNISIPVFQQGSSPKKSFKNFPPFKQLKSESEELKKYIEVIQDYYSQRIAKPKGEYLQTTVYCTKNIIAINFEITPNEPKDSIIWRAEGQGYLDFLAATAFQKVSSKLFIQKDLKGIRPNSFYVIKPNQYKLWHPAIAHLDILEFDNKMINLQINHPENAEI